MCFPSDGGSGRNGETADRVLLGCAVSADDQVKAYIKKIMSQLDRWMVGGKISKLVLVITDKDTGEHVERWQFDVQILAQPKGTKSSSRAAAGAPGQENAAPR